MNLSPVTYTLGNRKEAARTMRAILVIVTAMLPIACGQAAHESASSISGLNQLGAAMEFVSAEQCAPDPEQSQRMAGILGHPSTLHTLRFSGTGSLQGATQTVCGEPGWSFVRSYEQGGQRYFIKLKNRDGALEISNIDADGRVSTLVSQDIRLRNATSAEVYRLASGKTILMAHDRQRGRASFYELQGSNIVRVISWVATELKFRDIVKPVEVDGKWFLFALNRWNSTIAVFALNNNGELDSSRLSPVFETPAGWERGWSHVESFQENGNTYLLLYKTETQLNGPPGGKISTFRLLGDGSLASSGTVLAACG